MTWNATGAASSRPATDEKPLVEAAQHGNSEAFARLYEMYVERIFRYVNFRINDDQSAEDVTSEVFLKAWQNITQFHFDGSPFIAWLYQIAHHAVIDQYRSYRPAVLIPETGDMPDPLGDDPEENVDAHLKMDRIRHSIHKLTDEQQEVILLKFIAGFSTEEIARHLGKRQGAIRALQMRALKVLSEDLGWAKKEYE